MGSKDSGGSNPSADLQAKLAQDIYNQTNPLRQAFINRSANFLGVQPYQAPPPVQSSSLQPGQPGFGYGAYGPPSEQIGPPGWMNQEGVGGSKSGTVAPQPVPQTPQIPQTPITPFDPAQSILFHPAKTAIETQYNNAKNSILSSLPSGGGLSRALGDLSINRANALTSSLSDITQQEYNTALQLASGGQAQAMSGLGQSGAINAQLQAADAARQASAKQGLGSGLGFLAGSYLGGPAGGVMASRK